MEATIMYDSNGRQEQIRPASSTADGMHPLHPSSIIVDDSGGKGNASLVEKIRSLEDEVGGLQRGIQELRGKMAAVFASREVKLREPVTELEKTVRQPKEVDNGDEDEEDSYYFAEEFDVGLGDKLRLIDMSARAIEVLNEVTMRCSWCTCSTNTYGFLVRNLLLRGSIFENQLVEDTSKLLFLSFTGVFFSASMQFILAYYLFLNMPGYFGSNGEEKERSFASGTEDPLPSYQYPALMYQNANDVCRTEQIVQIICIGLFLFYVLNNIPGIIKNALIIARSERFISKDEEDITKLHYWRESDHSRRLDESDEVRAEFINSIIQGTASVEKFCFKCCNQLQRVEFENDSYPCEKCGDRIKKDSAANRCQRCNFDLCANCFVSSGKTRMREKYALPQNQIIAEPVIAAIPRPVACENLPLSFFEITDTRNFLGEVLEDLEVDKGELEVKANAQDLSFADKAKVSLVYVDYLRPNVDRFPSWTIFIPFFNYLQDFGLFKACSARLDQALKLAANVRRDRAGENGRNLESPVAETSKVSMEVLYKRNPRQFKDLPYFVELFPFNFRFVLCRWLAFIFGVLPELITLIMITIAGIQYILWSGYKIDSDSRGIEEIILATVAITFIYDIDEAIYDHILPEFYKDAHERDQFELIGWIPLASSKQLSLVLSWDYNLNISSRSLSHKRFGTDAPHLHINSTESESEHGQSTDNQKKRFLRVVKDKWQRQHGTAKKVPQWVDGNIPMSEDVVLSLSADKNYNDFYLALQYPFLYAKKLRFVLRLHLWEKFLVFYSTRGIHYFLLLALTLAIVGKYRTMAQCNRFAPKGWDRNAQSSIWATQEWPTTCLMAMGTATPVGSKVTDLYQNVNGMVVPVSCVKKGYLPDQEKELAALEESGYANDMSTIPASD